MSRNNEAPPHYRAVVFQRAPETSDFTCSRQIVLPGEHSAEAAWQAVYAALEEPAGGSLIGGEVVPV